MFKKACFLGCLGLFASPASAALMATQVTSGLATPMYATHAPGDPDGLYIALRSGGIVRLDLTDPGAPVTPVLTIGSLNTAGEGGLLGLAFHPDYENNGHFYVYVTTAGSSGSVMTSEIRRYTNGGGPESRLDLLKFGQPQANHNGGWIGFNPQAQGSAASNLYIMSGDGGGTDDNDAGHTAGTGNAQDLTSNLLGKVLRINVDGDDFPADTARNYAIPGDNPFVNIAGDDEIFAYGLRNPFRASFDRQTGDLYIGDVGQTAREEIDLIPNTSTGGENFGWRLREGDIATPTGGVGGPEPADYVAPLYDYLHGSGDFAGNSVTGGVLYRGPVSELQGKYVFGDYISDNLWAFDPADPDGTVQRLNDLIAGGAAIDDPVAFAEDAAGNLYIVDLAGEIFLISAVPIPGDTDGDGDVDDSDLGTTLANYTGPIGAAGGKSPAQGDTDNDGDVDDSDLGTALTNYTGPIAPVPEPASIALLSAAGLLLARRRR